MSSVISCDCDCVCLCVRALTRTRLELLTVNLVHIQRMIVARRILVLKLKGQRSRSRGYQMCCWRGCTCQDDCFGCLVDRMHRRCHTVKLTFHEANIDTDILARIVARMSVSVSWNASFITPHQCQTVSSRLLSVQTNVRRHTTSILLNTNTFKLPSITNRRTPGYKPVPRVVTC